MLENNPNISIVVPLYNEEESLPELLAWIERVMAENRFSYEVIFVDDGSNDRSWEVIRSLHDANPGAITGNRPDSTAASKRPGATS